MILLIVFFAVTNTLSMTVVERTRETGTLLALGTLPRQIVRNFVLEGMIMGIAHIHFIVFHRYSYAAPTRTL